MLEPHEQRFPWALDWNLLRTFLVIVERRSITGAAEFLGLKQPSVSSALKRLEDNLGCKLVERKPNYFSITPAGMILYEQCSAIFGSLVQLPDKLENLQDELSGHINIWMTTHVISAHLDDVLARFAETHPRVTYTLSVAQSGEVINRVRQNRAAMGICLMSRAEPMLQARILFREYFALYCGKKHRLFGQRPIPLRELKDETAVTFQTEIDGGPLECIAQLRRRTHMRQTVQGVSTNLNEVRRMIQCNIGIGALPVHVAARDVRDGTLWQLPPYSQLPAVNVYLLSNPQRQFSEAERALLDLFDHLVEHTPLSERTYLGAPDSPSS